MKYLTTLLFFLVLASFSQAKEFKLSFTPNGQVLKINYQGNIVLTDKNSINKLYLKRKYKDRSNQKALKLFFKKLVTSKQDTTYFQETKLPFETILRNQNLYQNPEILKNTLINYHQAQALIIMLIESNFALIKNEKNKLVNSIITKKIGSTKKGKRIKSYKNKKDKQEIVFKVLDKHQLIGKDFLLVTEVLDGHFESLYFLTESTCIHSKGSLSWGISSDTLNYTLLLNTIMFKGINNSKRILNIKAVEIEYYSQKQMKNDIGLSSGMTNFQEQNAHQNKVMLLKPKN